MGVYDTFVYNCPHCGKETSSQTKLGDCGMVCLRIGDKFPVNGKLQMKEFCEHCGCDNCVIVEKKVIINFIQGNRAKMEEGLFGSCEECGEEE